MKQRILSLLLLLALCLSACGTSAPAGDGGGSQSAPKVPELKMEDIAWSVEGGIVDGQRMLMLECTNNSPYTIAELSLSFSEKDDLTDEQKENFYQDLTDTLPLKQEDLDELRERPIGMSAQTTRLLRPGQTDDHTSLCYYEGVFYVQSADQYELVQPDIAAIDYVADGRLYTMYYDFVSQKADYDPDSESAVYWPDNDLTQLIPQPESEYIKDFISGEDQFYVFVHGMDGAAIDAYLAQCKEAGFTQDDGSYGNVSKLKNADGYRLELCPDPEAAILQLQLERPEETVEAK